MSDATVSDDSLVSRIAQRLSDIEGRRYELLLYGLLLVWVCWMMITARGWSWDDKLIPLFAGIPTIVFILAKLLVIVSPETYAGLSDIGGSSAESEAEDGSSIEDAYQSIRESDEGTRPRTEQYSYAIRMVGWAMALPLLMYLIGFANALLLFVFAFGLRFFNSIRDTVVVTVVFSAVMYLFFWQIIGLNPWLGTLGIPSIVELLGLG
jgi:hypothetical protein